MCTILIQRSPYTGSALLMETAMLVLHGDLSIVAFHVSAVTEKFYRDIPEYLVHSTSLLISYAIAR